jgi:hypothetical protein
MATKRNPGKFDCYANADQDEPMFVLLGRDPMAGMLIRAWAELREDAGEDPMKLAEARECAESCDRWARMLGKTVVHANRVLLSSTDPNAVPGTRSVTTDCETCHGDGWYEPWPNALERMPCQICSGTGRIVRDYPPPKPKP